MSTPELLRHILEILEELLSFSISKLPPASVGSEHFQAQLTFVRAELERIDSP